MYRLRGPADLLIFSHSHASLVSHTNEIIELILDVTKGKRLLVTFFWKWQESHEDRLEGHFML